jgi:hypothetical protein
MGYIHKGKISINGNIDPDDIIMDPEELTVNPKDDAIHIINYTKGDFEWWYFDICDLSSDCFLKIVVHIGTDPLRTRILAQLAISINISGINKSLSFPFNIHEMRVDEQRCDISINDKILILTKYNDPLVYIIKIDIPGFKCYLKFYSHIEGWKPLGEKILYQSGKKKVDFSWVIPVPSALVEGFFSHDNKNYTFTNATGYHDHNYIKIDRKYPLYMDNLVKKWYWGKCFAGVYTMIFCDVYCGINHIRSLMVAEENKIIQSSNNLITCSIISSDYDKILKAEYPASLQIESLDEQFPLKAEFESEKILDRKDLLEGVNCVFKFLIKKLVAKPVYHGVYARARLIINNKILEGYGNFESMIFRGN